MSARWDLSGLEIGAKVLKEKEGQPSASRVSGPTAAEAWRRLKSKSAENESELLVCDDAIFLTSSDSTASALLGYAQEEQEMFEGEDVETEPSQSFCTPYERVIGDYGS